MIAIKVVILCGGKGTRLWPTTKVIPKPMAKIGDKPILWHIMKYYSNFGFDDFVLCLGYKGKVIEKYFNNGHPEWNIDFVDTGDDTQTGGRIKLIEDYIDGEDFFATYGDGLSTVNIDELLQYHNKHSKIATITVVRPQSQFGIVDMDENENVTGFIEKPVIDYWINGGFFVFNRKIFDYIEKDDVLEDGVFRRLTADNEMKAFKHTGFWKCMDTQKDVDELNRMVNSSSPPWMRWRD